MLDWQFVLIVAFPIFPVLFAIWKIKKVSWQKIFWYSLFFWYLIFAVSILFFPFPYQKEIIVDSIKDNFQKNQLIPFHSIYTLWTTQPKSIFLIQVVGNIILTTPLGFLLPIINKNSRNIKTACTLAILIPITIELSQYLISLALGFTYRITDIDDIILNFMGVMIGFIIWRLLKNQVKNQTLNVAKQKHSIDENH
jgi:glycopeptide antibiotics resistance protein